MNWKQTTKYLERQFSFRNQTELAAFFLTIAKYADAINHHPDAQIHSCNQLIIRLSTHEENGLSEKDFALAKWIDGLL